jgi:hypothetical protein
VLGRHARVDLSCPPTIVVGDLARGHCRRSEEESYSIRFAFSIIPTYCTIYFHRFLSCHSCQTPHIIHQQNGVPSTFLLYILLLLLLFPVDSIIQSCYSYSDLISIYIGALIFFPSFYLRKGIIARFSNQCFLPVSYRTDDM